VNEKATLNNILFSFFQTQKSNIFAKINMLLVIQHFFTKWLGVPICIIEKCSFATFPFLQSLPFLPVFLLAGNQNFSK